MHFGVHHGICVCVQVVEYMLPIRMQSLSREDRQEECKALMTFSVLTSALPSQPKGSMGWTQECIRLFLAVRLQKVTVRSALFGVEVSELITLKSKPPWALWLLWFQQKAVGILQTRN